MAARPMLIRRRDLPLVRPLSLPVVPDSTAELPLRIEGAVSDGPAQVVCEIWLLREMLPPVSIAVSLDAVVDEEAPGLSQAVTNDGVTADER